MKVLHILTGGGIGGIENLMKDYGKYSAHENHFLFLWNGGVVCDEMIAAGMHVKVWNITKKDYLFLPRRICKLTVEENFEAMVIHHCALLSHICNSYVIKHNKNIKCFTYLHSAAEDAFRVGTKDEKLYRLILRPSYSKAYKIIAISKYVANSITLHEQIPSDHVVTVYNGVDTTKFVPRKNQNDVLNLIYVGRLYKPKGIENILEGIAKIPQDRKYVLRIVGDGPEKERLVNLSKQLGVYDNVEFLGNRRDVPELLSKSDVFVHLPFWQEGFGITVIEAMAAGLICVVNDHGALPEIVEDRISGYIIKNDKLNNFVSLLTELIDNKRDLENQKTELFQMRKNAIERAKMFSIHNFVEKLDEVIES